MDYVKTYQLFEAMDNLETYSKMYNGELYKEDCDYSTLTRYGECIKSARNKIFDLVGKNK